MRLRAELRQSLPKKSVTKSISDVGGDVMKKAVLDFFRL